MVRSIITFAALLVFAPSLLLADEAKPKRKPRVKVSGTVTDAKTGEPIERFTIQAGRINPKDPKDITWGYSETSGRGGRYSSTIDWHGGWTARVIADGYKPMPIMLVPPGDVAQIEKNIKMDSGAVVSGIVLRHDGKPAANASVFVVGQRGLRLWAGKALDSMEKEDPRARRVLTDEDGKFHIKSGGADRLVVSSADIMAWPVKLPEDNPKRKDRQAKPFEIQLPKAARLVVEVGSEGAPAKEEVLLQFLRFDELFKRVEVMQTLEIENGDSVVLAGMVPGKYQIARQRSLRTGDMGIGRMLNRQFFELKSEETKLISFKQKNGARLKGRVTNLAAADVDRGLVYIREIKVSDPTAAKLGIGLGHTILDAVRTEEDGSFQTEMIAPGEYELVLDGYVQQPAAGNRLSGIRRPTYSQVTKIRIPETGEPKPLELSFEIK